MTTAQTPSAAPGWYADPEYPGSQRYWDGRGWTEHRAPAAAPAQYAHQPGRVANGMNVSYTRPQQGHSLTLWILLSLFLLFPVIGLIYYSASPNHYWHA